MSYNSRKKKDNDKQTVFANTVEPRFNPWKAYYSFITIDGKSHLFHFESKFRSVAEKHFNKVARSNGGIVELVGVLK